MLSHWHTIHQSFTHSSRINTGSCNWYKSCYRCIQDICINTSFCKSYKSCYHIGIQFINLLLILLALCHQQKGDETLKYTICDWKFTMKIDHSAFIRLYKIQLIKQNPKFILVERNQHSFKIHHIWKFQHSFKTTWLSYKRRKMTKL